MKLSHTTLVSISMIIALSEAAPAASGTLAATSVAVTAPAVNPSTTFALASSPTGVAGSGNGYTSNNAVGESVAQAPSLSSDSLDQLQSLTSQLQSYSKKKRGISTGLDKREVKLITEVLRLVADTGLAPVFIKFFVTDPTLQPIVINLIVKTLKSGLINMDSLFKALNNSGLAVSVIKQILSDCKYYVALYNDAIQVIKDLPSLIKQYHNSKRELDFVPVVDTLPQMEVRAESAFQTTVLTSFFESLKNSGLAEQVVDAILTDPSYVPFVENLLIAILKNGALNISDVINGVVSSGLISSLFKEFLNAGTFVTVIAQAFAALTGRCDTASTGKTSATATKTTASTTAPTTAPTTTQATTPATSTKTTATATTTGGGSNCKRRRRRDYIY